MNTDPVEILKQLVKISTYQEGEGELSEGMKKCSQLLTDYLEQLDFNVEVDELLNVTGIREFDGENVFLINSHYDTVPPSQKWKDPCIPKIEGDKLTALGASDAKGGIASTISALYEMNECRFQKLIIQFVNFEESTNKTAYKSKKVSGTEYFLFKHPDFRANYGVNLEPNVEGNRFTYNVNCTGRIKFTVKTIGKEAHSSLPERGRNAIYDMADIINTIRSIEPGEYKLDRLKKVKMPIHVATIEGGRALTVIPGNCYILGERRILPGEEPEQIKQVIRTELGKLEGIKFDLEFDPRIQKSYEIKLSEYVIELVKDAFRQSIGYTPELTINRGRTDSMYLYDLAKIKTVIIGPGQCGTAHKPYEHININRVKEFKDVMINLLSENN